MDDKCNERLSKLEATQSMILRNFVSMAKREEQHQKDMMVIVTEIRSEQSNQKGFWKGIIFTVTILSAGIAAALNYFIKGSS